MHHIIIAVGSRENDYTKFHVNEGLFPAQRYEIEAATAPDFSFYPPRISLR